MEQITGRLAVLEPVTLLAYAAALTSRVRLGSAVMVSTLRNPVQLAKAMSSLDQLSGGRLTVGLGLGPTTRLYPAYGVDPGHRVSRFAEGLRVMRALWDEPAANVGGEYWRLEGLAMEPKPVQARLPVWLGARTPAALRRAVRLAEAWMGAGSESPAAFLEQLAYVRGLLAESPKPGFTLSKRVYIAIEADAATARERLRPWLAAFYGRPEAAEDWPVCGSVEQCLEALASLVEAGAGHLMLHPLYDNLEQMEKIAAELAPRL
jgi:alkanesulfonate monooxygenase SsuD/methylene tetrahydromethanopterin reductase-like flavin-dependent oxidoreductase (luciferase family)